LAQPDFGCVKPGSLWAYVTEMSVCTTILSVATDNVVLLHATDQYIKQLFYTIHCISWCWASKQVVTFIMLLWTWQSCVHSLV